jgi:argininosuccinate lyase
MKPILALGGADDPMLLATDLAEWFVRERHIPFRKAHHIVGELVALSEKLNKPLNWIALLIFGPSMLDVFDLEKAMQRRDMVGAPGPKQVAFQLKRWSCLLQQISVERQRARRSWQKSWRPALA